MITLTTYILYKALCDEFTMRQLVLFHSKGVKNQHRKQIINVTSYLVFDAVYHDCQMNTFFCSKMRIFYYSCCIVLISCHGTSFKGPLNLTLKHIELLSNSLGNFRVSSRENNFSQVKINPITYFYSLQVDFIHWNNNKQPIFSLLTRHFPSL